MKKSLFFLLIAVMLVFSVAASNAPLTAAEFFANRNIVEDASTGGTIGFYYFDPVLPSMLNPEITNSKRPSLWALNEDGTDYLEEIDVSTNVFDIMAKFDTAKAYAGYRLQLFYNPEIIKPIQLYNKTVYDIDIINSYNSAELPENLTLGTVFDYVEKFHSYVGKFDSPMVVQDMNWMTDTASAYSYYLEDRITYEEYLNEFDDGNASMLAVKTVNVTPENAEKSELARWPFEFTDPNNNNWYRTTIKGSYDQFENDSANIAPTVTNDGIIVLENINYTGPTFDIVGAEKRSESELRFKSIYFSGINEVHDNSTWIVEAGVILYPSELLDGKTLDKSTDGALLIPTDGYLDYSTNDIIYSVVLTGLEGIYKDMNITAKAYVTYVPNGTSEEITVYSDPISRSIGYTGDTVVVSPENTIKVGEPDATIHGMLALLAEYGEATAEVSADWLK